jgi:hypothetical protein
MDAHLRVNNLRVNDRYGRLDPGMSPKESGSSREDLQADLGHLGSRDARRPWNPVHGTEGKRDAENR